VTAVGHTNALPALPAAMAESALLGLAETREHWQPKDLQAAVRIIAHPTLDEPGIQFAALAEAVERRRDLECGYLAPCDVDERYPDNDHGYEAALHRICEDVDFALRPLLYGRRNG
jgi:hypothetical protein